MALSEKRIRRFTGLRKASSSELFECLLSGWIPDSMLSGVTHDLKELFAEWEYLSQ
jgi:hypothetical protein